MRRPVPSDARPLRILWVTTSAGPDGPGRSLSAILSRWPAHDHIAVCGLRSVDPAFRSAVPARVETMACDMRSLFDARAIRRLVRLCAEWQPDVIHTQLSRADWIGRSLAAARGTPVVSTIQNVHSRMYGAEFNPLMARIGTYLDRFTFPFAERLIAVSAGVKRDLEAAGVDPARVVVIPNTFDPSRVVDAGRRNAIRSSWGVGPHDVVVGHVALLKPQKGIRNLVEAARRAVQGDARVRFVQMGDGPLREDIERWIAEAGLGDRFSLLGRVPDPMTLLPGLDVFVLPSEWEGLPIALLEAMAAGLPAIGTRVAGIEDTIVNGETGRLVPLGDVQALADAILELAASPDLRENYGRAARERVTVFDAGYVASAYRQLYLETLAASGTSRF